MGMELSMNVILAVFRALVAFFAWTISTKISEDAGRLRFRLWLNFYCERSIESFSPKDCLNIRNRFRLLILAILLLCAIGLWAASFHWIAAALFTLLQSLSLFIFRGGERAALVSAMQKDVALQLQSGATFGEALFAAESSLRNRLGRSPYREEHLQNAARYLGLRHMFPDSFDRPGENKGA